MREGAYWELVEYLRGRRRVSRREIVRHLCGKGYGLSTADYAIQVAVLRGVLRRVRRGVYEVVPPQSPSGVGKQPATLGVGDGEVQV